MPSDAAVTLPAESPGLASQARTLSWCIRSWVVVACLGLSAGAVPAAGQAPRPDEYRVGVRDVVAVVVFGQEDLSGKFTVAADGTFAYPLLGEVKAAGLTSRELAASIRDQLADGFIREPQVSVTVADYQSRRVFVVGEVGLPGTVPLTGSMTLLEALARAGGVGVNAGTEIVVLRPDHGGSAADGPVMQGQSGVEEVARLAIDDLQSGAAVENLALRDGDTIFVPRGEQVFVLGQVATPGPVPYSRELTVFRALSLAGGATDLGATGRIRIVRIDGGERKETRAKLTDHLLPGDTIVVPTRWF
jgi:polysaccharide biosynthesis/export protein